MSQEKSAKTAEKNDVLRFTLNLDMVIDIKAPKGSSADLRLAEKVKPMIYKILRENFDDLEDIGVQIIQSRGYSARIVAINPGPEHSYQKWSFCIPGQDEDDWRAVYASSPEEAINEFMKSMIEWGEIDPHDTIMVRSRRGTHEDLVETEMYIDVGDIPDNISHDQCWEVTYK